MKSSAVFFGTLRIYTVKVEIRVRSDLLRLLPELLRSGRKRTNWSNFVTCFQINLAQNLKYSCKLLACEDVRNCHNHTTLTFTKLWESFC